MPLTPGWQGYCVNAAKILKPEVGKNFDMVTASGISGQCVAFYLAVALEVPFCLVRKEPTKDGGYGIKRTYQGAGEIAEFWRKHNRPPKVCFVDDWIAGGGTRRETCAIIHQFGGDCVYEYLYADYGGRRAGHSKINPSVYAQFGPVMDPIRGGIWTPPSPVKHAVTRVRAAAKPAAKRVPSARKKTTLTATKYKVK